MLVGCSERLRILLSVWLLRLLRLARVAKLAAKGLARGILRHRGCNWVLLIVLVLNPAAATPVILLHVPRRR
jgi:hypothetical protein